MNEKEEVIFSEPLTIENIGLAKAAVRRWNSEDVRKDLYEAYLYKRRKNIVEVRLRWRTEKEDKPTTVKRYLKIRIPKDTVFYQIAGEYHRSHYSDREVLAYYVEVLDGRSGKTDKNRLFFSYADYLCYVDRSAVEVLEEPARGFKS